jgi:hypothetical protein
MKQTYSRMLVIFLVAVMALAGCSSSKQPASGNGTPSAPYGSKQLSVTPMHFEQKGYEPIYLLTADIPTIVGSEDPNAQLFNSLTYTIFQTYENEFIGAVQEMPVEPVSGGSTMDIQYTLVSPPGDSIISINYLITGLADGAEYKFHSSRSFNFNIEAGQEVTLAQLFLPNVDYLNPIAQICTTELSSRIKDFSAFLGGVEADEENYQVWNVSADGLVITFDEIQISLSPTGPEKVTIPYEKLKDIIDPQGPIGKYIR